MKYAVKDAAEKRPGTELLLSFFFNGRGSELQKLPIGLFCLILRQLLEKVPHLPLRLVQAIKRKEESVQNCELNQLFEMFDDSLRSVLEKYTVRIFIDALDECREDSVYEVVNLLQGL